MLIYVTNITFYMFALVFEMIVIHLFNGQKNENSVKVQNANKMVKVINIYKYIFKLIIINFFNAEKKHTCYVFTRQHSHANT